MSLQDEIDASEKIETEVASATRNLRQQVQSLTTENQELRQLSRFYSRAEVAPIAPPVWRLSPQTNTTHAGIVMAQLTDTHFDEVIAPEEVMFINAYNREIALIRLQSWVEKVIVLPRKYWRGVTIEGLVIPVTGDILSGDIHEELKNSNEDLLYASMLFWAERLIAAIELLTREYKGCVEVAVVVGNHGRSTQKPVYKGRAQSNIEWLMWSIIRDRLADRKSNAIVRVSNSMDFNLPVYGRNHLLTHGDQFRGGSGISAAMSPLMLGQHRKSVRQEAAQLPMGLMVMGHYHQVLDLPGLVVGGSMKGYDEYAFGNNFRPEEAAQLMWLTTPERIKTVTMPIYLQNREAENW
jgi:hypothetical protein